MVRSYHDLKVWQSSRKLVAVLYRLTEHYPTRELYGLTSQMRRAAVSIPSNIAEGSSKRSTKEFIRFNNIAYGSLMELETQIFLSLDLSYISDIQCEETLLMTKELGKMLNGLQNSLQQKLNSELRTLNSEHA